MTFIKQPNKKKHKQANLFLHKHSYTAIRVRSHICTHAHTGGWQFHWSSVTHTEARLQLYLPWWQVTTNFFFFFFLTPSQSLTACLATWVASVWSIGCRSQFLPVYIHPGCFLCLAFPQPANQSLFQCYLDPFLAALPSRLSAPFRRLRENLDWW